MRTTNRRGTGLDVLSAVLAHVLLATPVLAATYYVDYAAGNDSALGTAADAAWKHCPGDSNATGTAAGILLQAGDVVLFKGGVVYSNYISINLTRSGSAAQPIVFDGSGGGTWGTGRAILDGAGVGLWGFYAGRGLSYVTIRGFEIRNSARGDHKGVRFAGYPNTGIIVEQCYIHDFGDWEMESPSVQGGGIVLNSANGCVIRSNEVTRTGNTGVFIIGGTNSVVQANNVHHYVNWCIGASSESGNSLSGLSIVSNRLHDFYHYDSGFRQTLTNRPHSNGIFVYRGSGGSVSDTTISHNLIWNDVAFTNSDGSYMINTSVGNDGLRIFNNVLINPHSYMALGLRDDDGGAVWNNTIYAPRCTALLLGRTGGAFDVKNNIFVARQTAYYWTYPEDDVFTADYNAFSYDGGGNFAKQDSPYKAKSWTAWREAYPARDGSSVAPGTDLGFVSVDGYPTNCLSMDLRLAAGSPCIGAAANLNACFNTDFAGTVRGAQWDIGACGYAGASARPRAPSLRPWP